MGGSGGWRSRRWASGLAGDAPAAARAADVAARTAGERGEKDGEIGIEAWGSLHERN
jgi:hypothetical protein